MVTIAADNYPISPKEDDLKLISDIRNKTLNSLSPYINLSNEETWIKAMFRDAIDEILGSIFDLKLKPLTYCKKVESKKAAMAALENKENLEFWVANNYFEKKVVNG